MAYVLFVLAFMPLLAMSARPELAGIVVLFAVALPFFVVYFRSPERKWWALIPPGLPASAGLVAAIVLFPGLPTPGAYDGILNAVMYLGIAVTFAVIGLRHHRRWALLFAILAAVMAVANGFLSGFQQYWPVLLVLAGFYLLYNAVRTKSA